MKDQNENRVLDLENLQVLLLNVLEQMDRDSLAEMVEFMDTKLLQEIILDVLGISQNSLSPEEALSLSGLIESSLKRQNIHHGG